MRVFNLHIQSVLLQRVSVMGEFVQKKAVPLHAMETLGGRGDIAPTHSRPRH
jgi:hypothetical protein